MTLLNIRYALSKMLFCSRRLTIPVISLNGVISSSSKLSFKETKKYMDDAFDIPFIKTVVININSPGGSPVQSELIYKYIRRLAKEKDVEVITFIEDCAASGGYYLACAGDEIYASANSIIGSIGVVSSGFGLSEFIKKHGIERRIYTQGENKALLDPFLPQKQSDIDILNNVGKDIHENFIDHVKKRRGNRLCSNDPSLFTGKIWSGKAAKDLGLIDEIGDMYSILENKYGKNINIKFIKEKKGLFASIKNILSLEIAAKTTVETTINSIRDALVWANIEHK